MAAVPLAFNSVYQTSSINFIPTFKRVCQSNLPKALAIDCWLLFFFLNNSIYYALLYLLCEGVFPAWNLVFHKSRGGHNKRRKSSLIICSLRIKAISIPNINEIVYANTPINEGVYFLPREFCFSEISQKPWLFK